MILGAVCESRRVTLQVNEDTDTVPITRLHWEGKMPRFDQNEQQKDDESAVKRMKKFHEQTMTGRASDFTASNKMQKMKEATVNTCWWQLNPIEPINPVGMASKEHNC